MEIKGTIDYKIDFTDNRYEITFSRGVNAELAATMITRENIKFAKSNLMTSVEQAKGKDLDLIKDRLGKVTSCEYILGMVIEQMLAELLVENELSAESQEKVVGNPPPNTTIPDKPADDNKE